MTDPICGINVEPRQRFDVVWTAREAGRWLFQHQIHHTLNDNVEEKRGGGLTMIINVMPSR